jgi:DNA-binding MarR family transcriptional regulator/GNAT superfamily N-acetyltransferase
MQQSGVPSDIANIRAFNRIYTQRLGLLNSHLDQSPFTLSEARVLYELAQRSQTAADMVRTLGLDRAQLSRTLKRFADRGLVTSHPDETSRKKRQLSLTSDGRAAFDALEKGTNLNIAAMLKELTSRDRSALLTACQSIRRVFGSSMASKPTLRGLKPGDIGWIVHRQMVLYAEEYGWNNEFEALAARILSDFVENFDHRKEAAWIAELDGRIVGSVFLVRGDQPETGKLRMLYVEPDARGKGIGSSLVEACISRAEEIGYKKLVLWTNSVLTSARHIYEKKRFNLIEEHEHHSFGHKLLGQTYALSLPRITSDQ